MYVCICLCGGGEGVDVKIMKLPSILGDPRITQVGKKYSCDIPVGVSHNYLSRENRTALQMLCGVTACKFNLHHCPILVFS